jgi:uncharacterized membrane protein
MLLLLPVQGVRGDDQVLQLLDGQLPVHGLDGVAGVHGSVVGETAGAVGGVDVRLVTFFDSTKIETKRKEKRKKKEIKLKSNQTKLNVCCGMHVFIMCLFVVMCGVLSSEYLQRKKSNHKFTNMDATSLGKK